MTTDYYLFALGSINDPFDLSQLCNKFAIIPSHTSICIYYLVHHKIPITTCYSCRLTYRVRQPEERHLHSAGPLAGHRNLTCQNLLSCSFSHTKQHGDKLRTHKPCNSKSTCRYWLSAINTTLGNLCTLSYQPLKHQSCIVYSSQCQLHKLTTSPYLINKQLPPVTFFLAFRPPGLWVSVLCVCEPAFAMALPHVSLAYFICRRRAKTTPNGNWSSVNHTFRDTSQQTRYPAWSLVQDRIMLKSTIQQGTNCLLQHYPQCGFSCSLHNRTENRDHSG